MEKLTILQTGPLDVNTYLVPLAEDAVLVVDAAACAFTGDEHTITDWLSAHGKRLAGILLTHGHFDHILGLAPLKKTYPVCKIAIHKDDAFLLEGDAQAASLDYMGLGAVAAALKDLPQADCTFLGGETLDAIFADGQSKAVANALASWRVVHTPGHTQGSCCFYNEERGELISGDTVFFHSYGRTDLPGGDEIAMQKSLAYLKESLLQETRVYPGHDYYGFAIRENY